MPDDKTISDTTKSTLSSSTASKTHPSIPTTVSRTPIASRVPPHIAGLMEDIKKMRSAEELYNMVLLEIGNINIVNPVKVIKGPGYDIERIPSFLRDGRHSDVPGFATPHPFIFEAGGTDAELIKNYFDQYLQNPLDFYGTDMSMIIQDLDQSEVFRWNFLDFVPDTYRASTNGHTKFKWVKRYLPDEDRRFSGFVIQPGGGQNNDPNMQELSNNLETDKLVEISGVSVLYTQVEVNESNRTMTLTYRYNEGKGILPWVKELIEGIADKRSVSIIEEDNGTEISRKNYYECFPIKYEQFEGFSLYAKLQTRVVIAFGSVADG